MEHELKTWRDSFAGSKIREGTMFLEFWLKAIHRILCFVVDTTKRSWIPIQIIFVVLRLTGVCEWDWYWVASPVIAFVASVLILTPIVLANFWPW